MPPKTNTCECSSWLHHAAQLRSLVHRRAISVLWQPSDAPRKQRKMVRQRASDLNQIRARIRVGLFKRQERRLYGQDCAAWLTMITNLSEDFSSRN